MRHATGVGLVLGMVVTVSSWVVFPGAVAAPTRPPAPATTAVDRGDVVDVDVDAGGAPGATPTGADRAGADRSVAAADRAAASADPAPDEASLVAGFVAALNEVRAEAGVGPLGSDDDLAALASDWAGELAAGGALAHSELIYEVVADARWRAAGENVGFGPDVATLTEAFRSSTAHHANMVDPAYASVGVGVVVVDGVVWTAHLFAG